ncbi:hypothetical protein MRB53_027267 [Persea americana]|uniref:Uncharacterized protein n=1 Tax=Persea americana TaxID=3435 RepID=A0ACC2LKI3_PERAE|nr:hypothetical protein MRB53_027267 [Persea americana]
MKDTARATVIRTSILSSSASPSRSSRSSKKKPYIPSKPSSSTPKTLNHFPILSTCHSCGTRANTALQTLASQWRIVLLCPNCITSIESSEICSYCFSKVSISPLDGIDCSSCDCRVHRSCLSFLPTASNSFTCVDCWEPKARKRPSPPPPPPDPASDSSPRSVIRERRGDLQDVEKVVAAAATARERAGKKAASAKEAAERARTALGIAFLVARDENSVHVNKELAAQLHSLMISSPRISRVLSFADSGSIAALDEKLFEGIDFNGYSISEKIEACISKIFENHVVTDTASDRNSSVELELVNGEMTKLGDKQMENGGVEGLRRGQEVGAAEKFDGKDERLEMPMREEQGSCSNKVANSSEDDNSVESGSGCCGKQNGVKDMDSSKCGEALFVAGDNGRSSNVLKRRCDEPRPRRLITYMLVSASAYASAPSVAKPTGNLSWSISHCIT